MTEAKKEVLKDNAFNIAAQQKWLHDSENPDHKYLTSDEIDTKNLANLVGDNAATSKLDTMKGIDDRIAESQKNKGNVSYAS